MNSQVSITLLSCSEKKILMFTIQYYRAAKGWIFVRQNISILLYKDRLDAGNVSLNSVHQHRPIEFSLE